MSQTKAQLIQPIGIVTAGGVVVTGVVTASSFDGDVVGTATSIISGGNLNLGDVNATTFSGDFTGNATGIITGAAIKVGSFTATSFTGDFTGTATSMMRGTGFKAGAVNATGFHVSGSSSGNVTGNVTGNIVGDVTGVATGNITGDVTGNITGYAKSVTSGNNIHVGVMTAASYYGDGSNLTGIAATNYNTQTVTVATATTSIDLSAGNMITLNSIDTSVSFANTSEAMDVTVVRNAAPTFDSPAFTTGGVVFRGSPYDGLEIGGNTDFQFGTGAYTIEFFIKTPGFASAGTILFNAMDDTGIRLHMGGENNPGIVQMSEQCPTCGPGASDENRVWSLDRIDDNEWHHVAIARGAAGSTTKMWIDGKFQAQSTEDSNNFDTSEDMHIGVYPTDSGTLKGTLSSLKIVKGTAIYTGTDDFTPPVAALTNTTNTVLLCCQSDSSATAATVIPSGESITVYAGSPTAGSQSVSIPLTSATEIAWPDSVQWNGGSAPTLLNNISEPTGMTTAPSAGDDTNDAQQFQFITRDSGVTWYAWESYSFDAPYRNILLAGYNASGTMGQNDTASYSSPVQMGTDNTWPTYMDNGAYACNAVKKDNTLWVWGSDSYGQLGVNGLGAQSSPIQIPGSWSVSSQGNYNAGAIKTDGTLWTWGYNASGDLGQNTTTNYSSPRQVGTDNNWKAIHMDNSKAVATKTDGTLWCWGLASNGEMGNNRQPSSPRFSSPVQVGEDTDWGSTLGGAWSCLYAYKTNGTLWTWGQNENGQLGHNNRTNRSSPTQLEAPGMTGKKWSKVVGGYTNYFIAVRSDQTLWTWGRGNQESGYGNLGLNQSSTQRSRPTQVGTSSDWKDCSASATMCSSIKTNGTLWSWGYNHQGQLGHNDTVWKSSPTQVGTATNWVNTNNPLLGNLLATQPGTD